MDTNDTNKKIEKLHHANVIVGGNAKDFVFEILSSDLNFKPNANPDFFLQENLSFGIDDARSLERWSIGKPLLGETKVSLIISKTITLEAQNALLKVLEEPPVGTYFFLNLENLGGLLPTFISRVRVFNISENFSGNGKKAKNEKNNAEKFLRSGLKEKLAITRSFSKKEDKTSIKELFGELEKVSYKDFYENMNKDSAEKVKNILTAKIFSNTRGSSPKMLLEWLSCVV